MENPTQNLVEINNIYPTHLRRKLIHSSDRETISTIRAQSERICRNSINPEYIRSALNKFRYGFVYYDGMHCVGFCIWKEYNSTIEKHVVRRAYMNLLLICASPSNYKIGSMMLYDMDTYAHSQTMNYITLQPATPELIKFYEKAGYTYNTITKACDKPITPFIILRPDNAKTRKLRRQRQSNNFIKGNNNTSLNSNGR